MKTNLGRFIQLPIEVLLNENLNSTDLRVWCFIEMYSSHGKSCFASNSYLCDKIGTSKSSLVRSLCKLKDLKFIREISFDGRIRKLETCMHVNVKSSEREDVVEFELDLPERNEDFD